MRQALADHGPPAGRPAAARTGGEGRRRGRPPGARTEVIRTDHQLGRPHFAFLRACFQGLDPKAAWDRYLAPLEPAGDRRRIERRRGELLRAVLRAARRRAMAAGAGPEVLQAVQTLQRQPQAAPGRSLPSLSDWVAEEGLDPDMYGEAELLALYREHHGLDLPADDPAATPHGQSAQAQVRALNLLEPLLIHHARPEDPVALWLVPRLAQGLVSLGLRTLRQACEILSPARAAWYRGLRGVGAVQARAVERWLRQLAGGWAILPPPGTSDASAAAAPLPLPCPFTLRPGASIEEDLLPRIEGAPVGELLALQQWLDALDCTPATKADYRKEVERFYLWCRFARGVTLSSLAPGDLAAYESFLAAVPAAWRCPRPVARQDAAWRPFRAPLSARSRHHALVVIRRLLADLAAQGMAAGQPWREVTVAQAPVTEHPAGPVVQQLIGTLRDRLQALPPSPRSRRLRAVVGWYLSQGLRWTELARPCRADTIPVKAHVWNAWRAHLADAGLSVVDHQPLPLALGRSWYRDRAHASRSGSRMACASAIGHSTPPARPLTAGAIRAVLARFVRRAVQSMGGNGPGAGQLPGLALRRLRGAMP